MSVYVGPLGRDPRSCGWRHLMADDTKELLTFARSIGLRAGWVQNMGTPIEHFDLTDAKVAAALAAGAIDLDAQGQAVLIQRKLERRSRS